MTTIDLDEAIATGMLLAWHAERQPDVSALVTPSEDRTFAELEANVNRFAHHLRVKR